jgi:hypothetical protein
MAGDNVTFFPSEYGDLTWRNVTFPPQNMATKNGEMLLFSP